MKTFFLIFILFALFALIGLVLTVNYSNVGVTGASSYLNTPKFIFCRYQDNDKWGPCYKIEQQTGTKCNPPEELSRSRIYYKCVEKDPENCPTPMNWFYRPCSFAGKFEGSQDTSFPR